MRRDLGALSIAFVVFVGLSLTYLVMATPDRDAGSAGQPLLLAFICVGPMVTGAIYGALRPRRPFAALLALGIACAVTYIGLNALWSSWQAVPLDVAHLSLEGWAVAVCTIPLLVIIGGSLAVVLQRLLSRKLPPAASASPTRHRNVEADGQSASLNVSERNRLDP